MEEKLIGISDFHNICRICMDNKKSIMISIFEEVFTELISYSDMLKECASISVSNDDMLPKQLCLECTDQLQLSYKLKVQCLYSEQILKNLVENASIQDEFEERNSYDEYSIDNDNNNPSNLENDNEMIVKNEVTVKDEPLEASDYRNRKTITYKCIHCQEAFNTKTVFITHVKNTHNKSIRSCKYCEKVFWSGSGLNRHMFKHGRKRKMCFENKEDTQEDKMIEYINIKQESDEEYSCIHCLEKFQIKNEMMSHVKSIHQRCIYECKFCDKLSWSAQEKNHHVLSHKQCDVCFIQIDSLEELKEHLNQHKSESSFNCEKCGKIYKSRDRLKYHMWIHNAPMRHLCTYCGKKFKAFNNYKTHLRIHTGEKPYSCDLCDAKFAQWYSLRSHTITHSKEKSFKCTLCDKAFARTNSLKRHILSHSDERNFPCDLCDKRFKDKRDLLHHKIIHTGERKHICKICEKTFMRRYHLTVHLRMHEGVKPHVCTICGKGFVARNLLNSHMKIHVVSQS